MFTKTSAGYILLSFLVTAEQVLGREKWFERDNRPVFLHPRRFGQEQPAVLQKLRAACPGEVCGNLAGQAVTPLLAAQPECTQQDLADAIIDASRQFDDATQTNMIAIAQEYRQAEKNTPPDFTTNPPTLRNSVFCQKAPKNPELNGLVQAQDPANDPDIFFDPALGKSVRRGEQANTAPFGGEASNNGGNSNTDGTTAAPAPTETAIGVDGPEAACTQTVVTVTVSVTNPIAASMTNAVTVTVGQPSITAAPSPTGTASSGNADFGSCSTPEIEFGVGFDNRKETSFRPADLNSFSHGSAQNIGIITQFICDSLTNTCDANQAAKDLCDTAIDAAAAAPAGTGAAADAFNAVFGITTNFVDVATVDNQGNVVPGTGNAGSGGDSSSPSNTATSSATTTSAPSEAPTESAPSSVGDADFGTCSVPEIDFAVGFDGRRETSFQPKDKNSFNHGSAQNIDIITRSICDTLTNSCNANQAAKDLCVEAASAASNATPPKSGAQADAFNAVFGIQTNLANVQQIDDQGRAVGGAGNTGGNQPNTQSPTPPSAPKTPPATSTTAATSAINQVSGSGGSNLQRFTGALGGVNPPAVKDLGNGTFGVDGTDSPFNDERSAVTRSCDVQNNRCADAANASGNKDGFTVQACNQQQSQCQASISA